ncbi:hypothetical protein KC19_2G164200 [Ceratodon purpureus]|uniref:Stress regulated protein n=1 Tax=Ceratodon purpureus TaxID=3225 RepID=A0A8T0IYF1_CERPU|nr:hypothetical protein KC19_2G164200 [Ceratodon purpureus]
MAAAEALWSGAAPLCCSISGTAHRCWRASSTAQWFGVRRPSHVAGRNLRVVCNLRLSESDEGSRTPKLKEQLEEELNAAKKGRVGREELVRLIDEALRENRDRDAVALAANLGAFGKAAMVPQRLYSLDELRLNKIDATRLLSPTDKTLGDVKRNLQYAAIAGGVVAWWQLGLDQYQLLAAAVLFLFLGTVDQIANGGGVEALLLDSLGRILSPKYQDRVAQHESGHFLVSYLVGILPKSFTLSSLDAFRNYGALNVQAGTTFVDYDFQEEVSTGKLSSTTLNRFSCVALAGVATEYLRYEVAEGGLADILQLDAILKGLQFSQKKADSQVRWAVLNTVSILRRHSGLQAKLAAAMSAGKSVGDCILLIENELDGSSDI